jgi:flagellar biosynthesis/type III secretory pathway protein FliH
MSSSPSRSVARSAPREPDPVATFQPFPYDTIPPGALRAATMEGLSAFSAAGLGGPAAHDSAVETAAREALVRTQGKQEGLNEARHSFDEQLGRERASLAAALAQFTRDRATYFQKVEGEVVQLALSIARRILHREAQLDPLLLAGMVRVALEKIDGATGVRLHINPRDAAEWRQYLTAHLDPAHLPEIIADPAQPPDRCTLETAMGTAAISMEVQLKEIEQGLMDLLAARPESAQPGSPQSGSAQSSSPILRAKS